MGLKTAEWVRVFWPYRSDFLAESFFNQIGVGLQETIVGPGGSGPGYNRTIILGGVPLAGFSSAAYDFRSGCEIIRAGWCGNVTFSASWLTTSSKRQSLLRLSLDENAIDRPNTPLNTRGVR
jgi:hypothetical protein